MIGWPTMIETVVCLGTNCSFLKVQSLWSYEAGRLSFKCRHEPQKRGVFQSEKEIWLIFSPKLTWNRQTELFGSMCFLKNGKFSGSMLVFKGCIDKKHAGFPKCQMTSLDSRCMKVYDSFVPSDNGWHWSDEGEETEVHRCHAGTKKMYMKYSPI